LFRAVRQGSSRYSGETMRRRTLEHPFENVEHLVTFVHAAP
jgi:hypothetical protein